LNYWLARSTDLVNWEYLPVTIPGSTDPFVYTSDSRMVERVYKAGAPYGVATYHYVIMGVQFSNLVDQLTYAATTTVLSNIGLDGLPPLTHSDWVFLQDFGP
jgi:hypothetical protein